MNYAYELPIFLQPVLESSEPKEVDKGTVALSERPMIGEKILIAGVWHKIVAIRHTGDGLVLELEDYVMGSKNVTYG